MEETKEMTAAEVLRVAANEETIYDADCNPWRLPKNKLIVLLGGNPYVNLGEQLLRLADKVEAEIDAARSESLRQGAIVWAKANGWPEFKEGEDFGAWLDRCTLPRPRFEDGEPVQFGGRTADHFGAIDEIQFCADGTVYITDALGNSFSYKAGTRIGLPAVDALDADGVPIKVGDTVWLLPGPWVGEPPLWGFGPNCKCEVIPGMDEGWTEEGRICIKSGEDIRGYSLPSQITHKNPDPDTQAKIDADALKNAFDYWGCDGTQCHICPAEIDGKLPCVHYSSMGSCVGAQTADLLRRQRELDRLTMGGE